MLRVKWNELMPVVRKRNLQQMREKICRKKTKYAKLFTADEKSKIAKTVVK